MELPEPLLYDGGTCKNKTYLYVDSGQWCSKQLDDRNETDRPVYSHWFLPTNAAPFMEGKINCFRSPTVAPKWFNFKNLTVNQFYC